MFRDSEASIRDKGNHSAVAAAILQDNETLGIESYTAAIARKGSWIWKFSMV